MTGPEDSHGSTRPISVAELLAKNGTIGAPPVGGRRRRRRGDTDSVTVAELTGEIPIVRGHDVEEAETTRTLPVVADEPVADAGPAPTTNGAGGHVDEIEAEPEDEYVDDDDDYADAVADYASHIEERDVDADPVDFFAPPPRRPQYTPDPRRFRTSASRGAEQMSPDLVDDEDLTVVEPPEIEDEDAEAAVGERDNDEPPSYLRSTAGPLFGGQTVADDLARRGAPPRPEDIDLGDEEGTASAPMSSFLRGALV